MNEAAIDKLFTEFEQVLYIINNSVTCILLKPK